MLLELNITNIALIESLRIEFAQGFNVLTGETGSGKSIVVDCMNLVLGGRADRDFVRTGAEKGRVEALFDAANCPRALEAARELGADCILYSGGHAPYEKLAELGVPVVADLREAADIILAD